MTNDIEAVFADAGARGLMHACDVDGTGEIGVNSDELVVSASTFKVAVALELALRAVAGEIDLTKRLSIGAEDRVMGPTGLSGFLDDAEVSIRDLAYQMITVSDNTATDVIVRELGIDSINTTIESLGLEKTVLVGDCRVLLDSLLEDLGVSPGETKLPALDPKKARASRTLRAEVTTRSTPREMTRLLSLIWRDEAGPPEACEHVRRWMGLQVWRDRLTSGFTDEIVVSGKTGTLPGIRNEVGVVQFPDRGRYAAAIFTVADDFAWRRPEIDRAIGEASRIAVEALRS